MDLMRRPWYSYILIVFGSLWLFWAAVRPPASVGGTGPGAVVSGPSRRVMFVWAGSALDRAGLHAGDLFLSGETIERSGIVGDLGWKGSVPREGWITIRRNGTDLQLHVSPENPAPGVHFVWSLLKLLNLGLVALALALFWQRPRDGRAVLLGMVLLSAPTFALIPEFRLWAVVLAAHFFSVFPTAPPPRWRRALGHYGSYLALIIVAGGLSDNDRPTAAAVLLHAGAIAFAAYSLVRVQARRAELGPAGEPVVRTLTLAAAAILLAVLAALFQRPWEVTSPSPLATLIPAVLFSAAVGHLVFRLRALEVKVIARSTIQYLLARWTLAALFFIPGFLLVYTLGVAAGSKNPSRPGDQLSLILWMAFVAILSANRSRVFQRLDRAFFRDLEAARQALIRLAYDLGGQPTPAAVYATLERGVREALRPRTLEFSLQPSSEAAVNIPIQRGGTLHNYLVLGPKESDSAYTSEERSLLEAAGVQAALALENARLSAALLERQRAELTARTSGILSGAEEERRRLAADLHDQVLPELRQIAGEFERLKAHANGLEPDLARLEGDVRGTMDSVREVMEALRPSALDMLGLGYALEGYFRKGAARCRPPITVSARHAGPEPELTPEQSLGLYRICQEAINNVLKHSGAARAGLEVVNDAGVLTLAVWDDGRGFDPARANEGHGLSNIGYRADLIGAKVEWRAREEGGMRFEARLPLGAAAARSGPA